MDVRNRANVASDHHLLSIKRNRDKAQKKSVN